ncbi:hypothetical protein C0995_013590 [Termitomyces sp. Mi166|nr:hypothetical protein C0995_001221 [Termitomyces sp. Mi166\
MTDKIGKWSVNLEELNIPAEPLAELLLEASDQIMSDALAVQQEQSKVLQAPVASSSKAGASSQGGA